MLIRQFAVSFWGFSASFLTAIYLGAGEAEAGWIASVMATVQTAVWTLGYLANANRHGRYLVEAHRLLSSIMRNRCPDCDKLALELTSETTIECLDCHSRFGVNKRDGMPRRLK